MSSVSKAARMLGLIVILGAFVPLSVRADAGLQLNPLKYEDQLDGKKVKSGFVDVSNPSDSNVNVTTGVKGFRQIDLEGNLGFFDDAMLAQGIRPGLDHFVLGPRESIRVVFSVDPSKLPQGGIYAAIFFATAPPNVRPGSTYIGETTNVGTLLILSNGGPQVHAGKLVDFRMPLVQTGSGLHGTIIYRNTNRDMGGLAFSPQLSSSVLLESSQHKFSGSLVLPTSERRFDYFRRGAFVGLIPVTLRNENGGDSMTIWLLACTGWYQYATATAGLTIIMSLAWWLVWRSRHRHTA